MTATTATTAPAATEEQIQFLMDVLYHGHVTDGHEREGIIGNPFLIANAAESSDSLGDVLRDEIEVDPAYYPRATATGEPTLDALHRSLMGATMDFLMDGDVPVWICPNIDLCQTIMIAQHGCASGVYMPAVTYHEARATMAEHGDEILEYLEQHDCHQIDTTGLSWGGICVQFVSRAVELWSWSFYA
jgi:hypothetical protein